MDSAQSKNDLANSGFFDQPTWFKSSFLDLSEDVDEANEANKQVVLYFHQDGCPYCKKLLDDNFSDPEIIKKMTTGFDLIELNMWGDKALVSTEGEELSEKEFAQKMKVMFTPTLIILDRSGKPQFRMNGYYAPDKFSAVLDYVREQKTTPSISFNDFYRKREQKNKGLTIPDAPLHTESFIIKNKNLADVFKQSNKPMLILFEQSQCQECNELHGDVFRRLPVYKQLQQFTIVQVNINSPSILITPEGNTMTEQEFARSLGIQYTPSMVFYGTQANNKTIVFRSEAYLKGFHIQALFDYVLTQAYLNEPEFQRFVQRRADELKKQGKEVNLWE